MAFRPREVNLRPRCRDHDDRTADQVRLQIRQHLHPFRFGITLLRIVTVEPDLQSDGLLELIEQKGAHLQWPGHRLKVGGRLRRINLMAVQGAQKRRVRI
ncbi:MAG: hypothetical protein QE273_12635, partial [Verrucomicrobiales bacterium]|nr:hypothetical protein [Verrucomicrobiales bacterium]